MTLASSGSAVQRLVSLIERDILDGAAQPGTMLGTESDLCARYNVGTNTLKQAARVLEAANLAISRRGNGGGLWVRGHSVTGVAKTIATYLQFSGATVPDLFPVTNVIALLATEKACQSMTLHDADAIRSQVEALGRHKIGYELAMALVELDQLLIQASGNPLMDVIYRVAMHFYVGATDFSYATEEAADSSRRRISALAEAIIAGELLRLPALIEQWKLPNQQRLQAHKHRVDSPSHRNNGARNLSEHLTHNILYELRNSRWAVGDKLGTEPELITRYGVSRATLRQAIRQLEQYYAVRSRTGPGGGIFVTAPDPERVLSLGVVTLHQLNANWGHLRSVMPTVSALAIDAAAAASPVALHSALRICSEAKLDAVSSVAQLADTLIELCPNKAISFLMRLLIRLQHEIAPPPNQASAAHICELLKSIHGAYIEGDTGRVKRGIRELLCTVDLSGRAPPP